MNEAEKYLRGLNDYLDQEIKETKEFIKKRAEYYSELYKKEYKEEDLYDLGMDKGVVVNYDQEDMENHNYEIGKLKTLESIKRIINP